MEPRTFKELIELVTWEQVAERFKVLYPDDIESALPGYEKVFNRLRVLVPTQSKMAILVDWLTDVDEVPPKPYAHVSGVLTDPDEIRADWLKSNAQNSWPKLDTIPTEAQHYAIEFTEWCEWLAMGLDVESLKRHGPVDFVVHAMWEMTYAGFDENKIQGMMSAVEEIRDEYLADAAAFKGKILGDVLKSLDLDAKIELSTDDLPDLPANDNPEGPMG